MLWNTNREQNPGGLPMALQCCDDKSDNDGKHIQRKWKVKGLKYQLII